MAEPTQISYRSLHGIGLLDLDPVYQTPSSFEKPQGNLRCCTYSPDGRYFAWASPEQVSVVDPSTGLILTTLPAQNVYELGFSPLGTFIITWQRPSKDEDGNATKNLKVWRTIDEAASEEGHRDTVGKFVQKSQTGWNLQYTSDEQFCARVVTNEVQFYQSADLATVWNKLHVDGVQDFAIAPGKEHSVAVFVPERKGMPAAVKVYNVPSFDAPRSQKTFFKGDKVQLKWNQTGTSLIVLATTDVDKSNRNYYGETNMYILSANGGFDSRIQLDKEGPIHDVSWSPNSNEFGVVYGYMPAKTVIFDVRANPRHTFPLGPRNTILFSPHGRFVLVGGFGNLAGQTDIYDLQKDYAKVGTIEASNASVCEWSPDGKHLLTATTSPRLRVDNGVKIWHILGGLMYYEEINELYEVLWRPQSTDRHPINDDPLRPTPTPHPSALAYLGTVKTPSKPAGAYRPPGARGTSTPLHFKREDEGGAAYSATGPSTSVNGFGGRHGRRDVPGAQPAEGELPPGAAPGGGVSLNVGDDGNLSKAALKNKKKREAKKAKNDADKQGQPTNASGEGELGPNGTSHRRGHSRQRSQGFLEPGGNQHRRERSRSPRKPRADTSGPTDTPSKGHQKQKGPAIQAAQAAAATAPQPSAAVAPPEDVTSPSTGSPHEKKVRALTKKLRAIDDLKMRQAAGEKLELSQISKIKTEEQVRKELEGIGLS